MRFLLRAQSARRLLGLFLAAALVPSAALVWLGWQFVEQERARADVRGGHCGQRPVRADRGGGVPLHEVPPRRLGIDPVLWRYGDEDTSRPVLQGDQGFSLSPDGRRIAMIIGKEVSEVWALENFLPAAQ